MLSLESEESLLPLESEPEESLLPSSEPEDEDDEESFFFFFSALALGFSSLEESSESESESEESLPLDESSSESLDEDDESSFFLGFFSSAFLGFFSSLSLSLSLSLLEEDEESSESPSSELLLLLESSELEESFSTLRFLALLEPPSSSSSLRLMLCRGRATKIAKQRKKENCEKSQHGALNVGLLAEASSGLTVRRSPRLTSLESSTQFFVLSSFSSFSTTEDLTPVSLSLISCSAEVSKTFWSLVSSATTMATFLIPVSLSFSPLSTCVALMVCRVAVFLTSGWSSAPFVPPRRQCPGNSSSDDFSSWKYPFFFLVSRAEPSRTSGEEVGHSFTRGARREERERARERERMPTVSVGRDNLFEELGRVYSKWEKRRHTPAAFPCRDRRSANEL